MRAYFTSMVIGICISFYTTERLDTLEKTLAVFTEPIISGDIILVIVIDKNSDCFTDLDKLITKIQLDDYVKIVYSSGIGLSKARTRGIEILIESDCEWIFFHDDDAIPHSSWFDGVKDVIQKIPNNVGMLSAKIIPLQSFKRSKFLIPPLYWIWGCSYPPIYQNSVKIVRNPIGASMGIRSDLITTEKLTFTSKLGRIGKNYLGCEETEFAIKANQRGYQTLYVPSIKVKHMVPNNRNSLKYLVKRCFYEGQSKRLIAHLHGNSSLSSENEYQKYLFQHILKHPRSFFLITIAFTSVLLGFLLAPINKISKSGE